ncbi:MAG TPA: DegT/DnrJ/EryC1/StrS family aminotransferase [Candidatus Binataceae bacterium]|nr:DegT/DnrJ/EryC1/StrS family aminotransferase [Candidatus Binataceae bacterium]
MKIRMIDLAAQNQEIQHAVERGMAQVHARTSYIGGPQVAQFEQAFAQFLGVKRVVGVGSGTDALRLALIAMGVRAGDEVITVPATFIATAEAIVQAGARPVFVDVDPRTRNMSPQALRRYLEAGRWQSPNGPRAILPVHLYGLPAPMEEITALGREFNIPVLEDACQAHGARVRVGGRWMNAGAIGKAGCFSFYPGKNLGGWGEGGALATNDEELAEHVVRLRDHGRTSHYGHLDCGYNARLDTIQAVVLLAKLEHLSKWNARRRELAFSYRTLLDGALGCELPTEPEGFESCYHLFVICHPRRDLIRHDLLAHGIECGIHYPLPLHLQPALAHLGYRKGDFPVSEVLSDSILSLPMHPHLNNLEVLEVVETITETLANSAGVEPQRAQS